MSLCVSAPAFGLSIIRHEVLPPFSLTSCDFTSCKLDQINKMSQAIQVKGGRQRAVVGAPWRPKGRVNLIRKRRGKGREVEGREGRREVRVGR